RVDRDHRAGHRQLTGTHRTATTIIPPSTLGQQARIDTVNLSNPRAIFAGTPSAIHQVACDV
ncbi:MAG TPA: hypothetical protein VE197_11865, partial [Mycobacterium sp.]|nr:hypothetical protein [Mycobacterium sp.]